MGTSRKPLVHPFTTARTILAGEAWGDSYNGNAMQPAIVAQPGEEQPPTGIADTLCQRMILDEVGNLQVFIGNEIARFHQRTRSLGREVFTLPTHFEIALGESFDGSSAALGTLGLAAHAPLQPLQFGFCLAQIAGILNH